MLICFVLSDRPNSKTSLAGTRRNLSIIRDDNDGPFYPHIAETTSPETYRFFAGHLSGLRPSAELPASHPVSKPSVEDWSGQEPDGSWLALKFDRRSDVLSIAADLFNRQKWFCLERDRVFYLSNSLRHLYKILNGAVDLEERAVPYMLECGYLPSFITPLKSVCELDVGETLIIRDGKGEIRKRSLQPIHRRETIHDSDLPVRVGETLSAAVQRNLDGLSSLTIPLSGGIDSRFLLGCALETLSTEQITTMSFGAPQSWDAQFGTAIACALGIKSVRLEMDDRSIGDIVRESFPSSEGLYWSKPDFPVSSFHHALPQHGFVLSGYIGDPIFGAWDEGPEFRQDAAGQDDKLLTFYRKCSVQVPWTELQPLLNIERRDPFQIEERFPALPGVSMQDKMNSWYYSYHTTNRTNYAVFPARWKAYYLAPFIERTVLDLAFAMPPDERHDRKAYFAALQQRFPNLYTFPATAHFGRPLGEPKGLRINTSRVWRRLCSDIDSQFGKALGVCLYQHPRWNYDHPRELLRKKHRPDILLCLDELTALPVFKIHALQSLRDRLHQHRYVNPQLLRGLLTIHQWMIHYHP